MKLAGLLLAGGRSSRMGRDKAELVIDGQTLLQRATALLEGAGATRVYVAGRADAPYCVPDRERYAGPAVAALDACQKILADGFTHVLVMPVDMPLMSVEALKNLVNSGAPAAAYEAEPLPFFASLEAMRALDAGPSSLRRLLSGLGAIQVKRPPEDLIFVNANTPEEWDLICKELAPD